MIKYTNELKKYEKEKYLIVGCSSGPDSMALLHYIHKNIKTNIVCAHINHNIRKQSIKEEKFLENYCKDNNIIFEHTTINNYKENNFENEARNKRYKFYEQIIKKYNAKYLFLAHHGDDLIETVIMKISRGSNLEGYAGIKETSKRDNYYIIRPFLKYTKEDIIEYNNINKIKYFIDKTNEDTKYTRNRIRKNIIPKLKEENKNIHKQFLKYSKTLLEYNDYIEKETIKTINKIYNNNYLDIIKFNKLDTFLQKNIIYKLLNNYYNNKPNIITEKHINNILNLIKSKKTNSKINLPKNTICIKEYNKLYFIKNQEKTKNYKKLFNKEFIIKNMIIKQIDKTDNNGNDICRLNSKEIKLPLYIRNRKDGDYIEVKGLNGTKKIKDIFIDKKVSKNKREYYPLLVDNEDNILWIPNIKKSKFNVKKDDLYDIILRYCEKEENNE